MLSLRKNNYNHVPYLAMELDTFGTKHYSVGITGSSGALPSGISYY